MIWELEKYIKQNWILTMTFANIKNDIWSDYQEFINNLNTLFAEFSKDFDTIIIAHTDTKNASMDASYKYLQTSLFNSKIPLEAAIDKFDTAIDHMETLKEKEFYSIIGQRNKATLELAKAINDSINTKWKFRQRFFNMFSWWKK